MVTVLALAQSTATLVAAGIAAGASIATLVLNLLGDRRTEMRAAHRQILGGYIEEIADSVHSVMAVSVMIRKRSVNGQDVGEWVRNGGAAAERLKTLRPRVRYQLPGLEEPFRVLSRLPDWTATFKGVQDGSAERLIGAAQELVGTVDAVVARSYKRGLTPNLRSRRRLARKSTAVRAAWALRFSSPAPSRWHPIKRWKHNRSLPEVEPDP